MTIKRIRKENVVGKKVFDLEATLIGTVTDLSFDLETNKIDFVVTTKKGTEINLVRKDINKVGDVILLKKAVKKLTKKETKAESIVKTTPETKPEPPSSPSLCAGCGYQNESSSKFCIKCGSKLS